MKRHQIDPNRKRGNFYDYVLLRRPNIRGEGGGAQAGERGWKGARERYDQERACALGAHETKRAKTQRKQHASKDAEADEEDEAIDENEDEEQGRRHPPLFIHPLHSLVCHSRLLECPSGRNWLVKKDGLCSYLQPPTSTVSHPQLSSTAVFSSGLWTEFVLYGWFLFVVSGGPPPRLPTKDSYFIHQVSSMPICS